MTAAYALLSLVTPVLYGLLTTAAYYLFARAMVTRFLWKRYPGWLNYYTWCAACSGVLYGVVVAFAIGWTQDLPFLGLRGRSWVTPFVVGLCSMIWTPVVANLHVNSLLQLGVSDPRAESNEEGGPAHAEKTE